VGATLNQQDERGRATLRARARATALELIRSRDNIAAMHVFLLRVVQILGCGLAIGMLAGAGCGKAQPEAPKPPPLTATIETDKGKIELELLYDVAPKAVENFVLLAQRKYYDGVKFFRVVKDFMIQTGDPQNDGKGGQSAWGKPFEDEIDRTSPLYRDGYKRGSVAMANTGPNTNQSQFFIVRTDYPLHPGFTIFARVIGGMETVDAIAEVPTKRGFDGGMSEPIEMPVIKTVTIHGSLPQPPVQSEKK
jgi:cyclophilin family peptidyl-prolyl cis-trans isomerase